MTATDWPASGRSNRPTIAVIPTSVESLRYVLLAAAVSRRPHKLISACREVLLDLGLSLHALGHVRKFVGHDFGSRSMQ